MPVRGGTVAPPKDGTCTACGRARPGGRLGGRRDVPAVGDAHASARGGALAAAACRRGVGVGGDDRHSPDRGCLGGVLKKAGWPTRSPPHSACAASPGGAAPRAAPRAVAAPAGDARCGSQRHAASAAARTPAAVVAAAGMPVAGGGTRAVAAAGPVAAAAGLVQRGLRVGGAPLALPATPRALAAAAGADGGGGGVLARRAAAAWAC